MAYATVFFKNPHTGQMRAAPVGFSWTTFFFGFFPAILRGHWSMGLLMIPLALVTLGLSGLYFSFAYNKIYLNHLMNEGYLATGSTMPLELIGQKIKRAIPTAPEFKQVTG